MAVAKDLTKKNLAIEYVDGQNDKGEDIIKKTSYNHIKNDAAPDNLYAVATALGNLMPEGVSGALTEEDYELSE